MTRVCNRCILPDSYKVIKFNANGICDYCTYYDSIRDIFSPLTINKNYLDQKLSTIPSSMKYHCIVGLSGGKESAYVLYKLRKEYGLNVLAFTFDNGFLTEYARNNIDTIVKRVGVDHLYLNMNWDLLREAYQQLMVRFAYPCMACTYALFGLLLKTGIEYGIPLIVHGLSRAQMFKELHPQSLDPRLPFLKLNTLPYAPEGVKQAWRHARRHIEYLLRHGFGSRALTSRFMNTFFGPSEYLESTDVIPELYGFFLSGTPDMQEMVNVLSKETGWQKPNDCDPIAHHRDCSIHPAAEYLSMHVAGYSLICPELSFQVRDGSLSREQALSLLPEKNAVFMQAKASIGILCSSLGLDRNNLPRILLKARIRQKFARPVLRFFSYFKYKKNPIESL